MKDVNEPDIGNRDLFIGVRIEEPTTYSWECKYTRQKKKKKIVIEEIVISSNTSDGNFQTLFII